MLQQVGARCDRSVLVGAVAAVDHSFVVRLEEEGQRLTGGQVACRGQQHSVQLQDMHTTTHQRCSGVQQKLPYSQNLHINLERLILHLQDLKVFMVRQVQTVIMFCSFVLLTCL